MLSGSILRDCAVILGMREVLRIQGVSTFDFIASWYISYIAQFAVLNFVIALVTVFPMIGTTGFEAAGLALIAGGVLIVIGSIVVVLGERPAIDAPATPPHGLFVD